MANPSPILSDEAKYKAALAKIAQLEAQTKTLEEEKARLAANQKKSVPLSFKVSEKGAVSVYGLMRFPVTLYAEGWKRLLSVSAELTAFIEANQSKLAVKGVTQEQSKTA